MKTILCIDPSGTIRKIIQDCVRDLGFAFLETDDIEKGLQIIDNNADIELLIFDWTMTNNSGKELLRKIKEEVQLASVKILVMIPIEQKDDVMDAIELGANMYVLKPFSVKSLQDKIQQLMENAE